MEYTFKVDKNMIKSDNSYCVRIFRTSELDLQKIENKIGVYLLVEKREDNYWVYVGETENMMQRILHHHQHKSSWSEAYLLFHRWLNKAHIKFLESVLYTKLKIQEINKNYIIPFEITNKETPKQSEISYLEQTKLLDFVEEIRIMLNVFQRPFFKEERSEVRDDKEIHFKENIYKDLPKNESLQDKIFSEHQYPSFSYEWAFLEIDWNQFKLLKNSKIRLMNDDFQFDGIKQKMIDEWELKLAKNGKEYVLQKDLYFSSPTIALQFVLSVSCNWWEMWLSDDWISLGQSIKKK